MILQTIKRKAKQLHKRILFVDHDDPVVLRACAELSRQRILTPVFVGHADAIRSRLSRLKIRIPSYDIIASKDHYRDFAYKYAALRKGHDEHLGDAKEAMLDPAYFSAMCLREGLVDGVVAGHSSKTKPFLPAFRIVGLASQYKRASSFFLMVREKPESVLLFADCGLNIDPSSAGLMEIAVQTAESAKLFKLRPKIALLSFSTKGSAQHDLVDKVSVAARMLKRYRPEFLADGELQVDAALIPSIARSKAPRSPLKGKANVLIFPDLNAGNIGYKLVERLAGYVAVGPILQGLRKPMNDMSRGASVEDIVLIACITALQAA